MIEIVMKFYAESLHKTSGISALEFLYYRIKNSNHSCEEIAKEEGNKILASLYRLVQNVAPILQR